MPANTKHHARLRTALAACIAAFVASLGVVSAASTPSPVPAVLPTPWSWPTIPSCLADPGAQTPGALDFRAEVCDLYQTLRQGGGVDIGLVSAQRMNAEFQGVLYPAFLPGTEVVRFVTTEKFNDALQGAHQLVRVSTSRGGAQFGLWWTTLDQVTENGHVMNAEAIRSKLALTSTPACIVYASAVHANVLAYLGVVAPAFDRRGGGIEWWFPSGTVIATTVYSVPGGAGCP